LYSRIFIFVFIFIGSARVVALALAKIKPQALNGNLVFFRNLALDNFRPGPNSIFGFKNLGYSVV